MKEQLEKALREDESLKHKELGEQCERLIVGPLSELRASKTWVMVIDAIDECASVHDEIHTIISQLSRLVQENDYPLKIVVGSRPELSVRRAFSRIRTECEVLVLHQRPATEIEREISAYLRFEIDQIGRAHV